MTGFGRDGKIRLNTGAVLGRGPRTFDAWLLPTFAFFGAIQERSRCACGAERRFVCPLREERPHPRARRGHLAGIERRERGLDGRLAERVGRNDAPRQLDQLRRGDEGSDARAGEGMRLRQGAQNGYVGETTEPSGEALASRPLDVGFVDHHDRLALERAAHALHGVERKRVAGWIVGRAQVHQLDVGPPGVEQPLRIELPATVTVQGNVHDARTLDMRRHLVHAERGRALQDRVLARAQENARQEVDGLVAPAGDQERGRRHAVHLSKKHYILRPQHLF